jgi:uncharacterized protein (DUF2237 family)
MWYETVMSEQKNVFGQPLECCCMSPKTGYFRTGSCETDATDFGIHTVCILATPEFLEYTVSIGNDLVTPVPEIGFAGLKEGDKWCLCASRYKQALDAGVAPPVVLSATHEKTLEYVELEVLKEYAIDLL